jgi:CMP-N,N'-diacetyllegionaminic acid synthase
MRCLAVIPARGGSKGVPRKNIKLLNGKPLLQYTAECALAARRLSRVILSTDDPEIAETARNCGIEAPFQRPAELAGDSTPMLSVIQHAVGWMERLGQRFDAICILQPTSPFRRPDDVDGCIDLLWSKSADSVITVLPVPQAYNPHWVYLQTQDGMLRLSTGEDEPIARRQDLPVSYHRDGSVYVMRRDVLMERNSLYGARLVGYLTDAKDSVNIDSLDDWAAAEMLLSRDRIEVVRNAN